MHAQRETQPQENTPIAWVPTAACEPRVGHWPATLHAPEASPSSCAPAGSGPDLCHQPPPLGAHGDTKSHGRSVS